MLDPEQVEADREWDEMEAAAAAGDWESLGIEPPPADEFAGATVDEFKNA